MQGTARLSARRAALGLAATCMAALALAGPSAAHLKMPREPSTALTKPLANTSPGTIYYTGYSHIDFNWLWDWPDTVHTWDSTGRTALNLMYRFPDYHFGETQAAAYMSMERIRPDLFRQIQDRVAEGRWSLLGGMWDESDTNLPSGEGLARSFLYGQDYFAEKFHKQARVGFLPDSFGHTRQLPQILQQAEIPYFYFQRCRRDKNLFWWQAPDGSKVLAYSSPGDGWYNDDPNKLITEQATWPNTILTQSGVNIAMSVFGVGNHGGGPTIQELQTIEDNKTRPGFPEVRTGAPEDFYEACLAQRTDFPTYDEELGFTFEGCYTTHGDIKRILRDSENELYVAESLATVAHLYGLDYPADDLRFGWEHSAFNHFHDIAPGTAIHSTYEEARNKQKLFKRTEDKVVANSWATLESHIDTTGPGQPLAVYNPVAWTRTDAVEATVPFDQNPAYIRVTDPAGTEVPAQVTAREVRDGKTFVSLVFVAENMPSMGYRVYHVAAADAPTPVADPLTVNTGTVTTPRFFVNVDATTGQVNRIYDRSAAREVLPAGQRALRFAILGENANNSAWNINLNGQTTYLDAPTSFQVLETGPVRAHFQATYTNGASTYTQDIYVYRNLDRIDARMTADFRDYNVLVKSVVPAALASPAATFDVPFYALQRPADGKVDVPMQKWVDVSTSSYGLSVLNDSKYGADVNGSTIRMSLLRGTHDPDTVGDLGFHRFALALYPHAGNWKAGGTMRRGYEFNLPLRVMPATTHTGDWAAERSFLSTNLSDVAVTAFKRAEDGNGYILRYYEYEGTARTGRFSLPKPATSVATDNILEHPIDGTASVDAGDVVAAAKPYTIHTLRIGL